VLEKGTNTRFVVTSKKEEPKKLYDWYVRRGEAEGWIKDLKRALKADRLSCHRFFANQFRLVLHAAAYWLLDALRACYEPMLRMPAACRRKRQAKATKCSPAKVAGSLS